VPLGPPLTVGEPNRGSWSLDVLLGAPLRGHSGAVTAVTVTQIDGRPVAVSGSSDQTLRVWDLLAAADL
jgi:WD40 repeat protein